MGFSVDARDPQWLLCQGSLPVGRSEKADRKHPDTQSGQRSVLASTTQHKAGRKHRKVEGEWENKVSMFKVFEFERSSKDSESAHYEKNTWIFKILASTKTSFDSSFTLTF